MGNPFASFTDHDLLSAYDELLKWDNGHGLPEFTSIREVAEAITLPMTAAMKLRSTKEFLLYEIASRYDEVMRG